MVAKSGRYKENKYKTFSFNKNRVLHVHLKNRSKAIATSASKLWPNRQAEEIEMLLIRQYFYSKPTRKSS